MSAYNELYLDDAMANMGDMVEYALCGLGLQPEQFMNYFISTKVASKFEKGNPKYVAGMSGCELAEVILEKANVSFREKSFSNTEGKGKEYWAGWILAYYQWYTGRRFEDILQEGLSLSRILSMYVLHEADESKFVESAEQILDSYKNNKKSKLHEIRKARGFTQQQLSAASGVTLRMIQLYEQRQNDIKKASVSVVLSLAKVLGCDVEDLLE